jgi:hypothetical protein
MGQQLACSFFSYIIWHVDLLFTPISKQLNRLIGTLSCLEVAKSDPTRKTRLTRSDLNPIWSDFLRKSKWSDSIRTRPDPTRDQMTFNPIEIYQRSEKTQHINWPDLIRPWPDPISSKKSNWPDPSDPNPIRPARLPPLVLSNLHRIYYTVCKPVFDCFYPQCH